MKRFSYSIQSKKILADMYTPVSVYMRLRDMYSCSALMESSDYHSMENARSYIGVSPIASIAIGHGKSEMTFPDGSVVKGEISE